MEVNPIYQVFIPDPADNNSLLTAQLPESQINPAQDFNSMKFSFPMAVVKSVACELYEENGKWYFPILIWAKAKNTELFDSVNFIPWRQAVTRDRIRHWTSINQRITDLLGRSSVCAVVGCKESSQRFSAEVQQQAFMVGKLAALSGYALLTGGLSGVMSKAAEGAVSINGATIGILPGTDKAEANKFIRTVFPSGIGIARNYQMALSCDVMIAVNGGRGTMEEMCFALDFHKPVISWGSWELDETQKANSEQDIFDFLLAHKEELILQLYDEVNFDAE